jgi:hypothetical protein
MLNILSCLSSIANNGIVSVPSLVEELHTDRATFIQNVRLLFVEGLIDMYVNQEDELVYTITEEGLHFIRKHGV